MRWLLRIVKIWPIAINLSILIVLICYMFNISINNYVYPIFGHSLFVDICFLIMSKALRFCFWHRLLIWNLIVIIVMEWWSVNFFIINEIYYVRTLLALVCCTILVSTFLRIKYGVFKRFK